MIREFSPIDFNDCRDLFIKVFNSEPWHDSWTNETAGARLQEFIENKRFFGFTLWEGDALAGAAFCHGLTYYKGNEVFVDELFISPEHQRKGHGKALMEAVETHARAQGYSIITLLTNRGHSAFGFYKGQEYRLSEYMVWMYKRVD